MNKKEFKQLEKIYKDSWKELALSGNTRKSAALEEFSCSCPACEIANRTKVKIYTKAWACAFVLQQIEEIIKTLLAKRTILLTNFGV